MMPSPLFSIAKEGTSKIPSTEIVRFSHSFSSRTCGKAITVEPFCFAHCSIYLKKGNGWVETALYINSNARTNACRSRVMAKSIKSHAEKGWEKKEREKQMRLTKSNDITKALARKRRKRIKWVTKTIFWRSKVQRTFYIYDWSIAKSAYRPTKMS